MSGREFQVLVAEDDADDAILIERAFARGCPEAELKAFRDGCQLTKFLEGLAQGSATVPGMLLLLDLKMPLMDGFQVLEWLRHKPQFSALVVVVLSGSERARDEGLARALGCRHYLVKPGSFHDLVRMARNLGEFWRTSHRVIYHQPHRTTMTTGTSPPSAPMMPSVLGVLDRRGPS